MNHDASHTTPNEKRVNFVHIVRFLSPGFLLLTHSFYIVELCQFHWIFAQNMNISISNVISQMIQCSTRTIFCNKFHFIMIDSHLHGVTCERDLSSENTIWLMISFINGDSLLEMRFLVDTFLVSSSFACHA